MHADATAPLHLSILSPLAPTRHFPSPHKRPIPPCTIACIHTPLATRQRMHAIADPTPLTARQRKHANPAHATTTPQGAHMQVRGHNPPADLTCVLPPEQGQSAFHDAHPQ